MSAQPHESRAQGLMALLAKGLVETSIQRTASSLGDRSRYVGMSDIGRALECPRAAVGNKLFGSSAELQANPDGGLSYWAYKREVQMGLDRHLVIGGLYFQLFDHGKPLILKDLGNACLEPMPALQTKLFADRKSVV